MKEETKLRTITTLSKLWDGSAIDRVRASEGAIVLPGRRLTMHLMMQPNVAAMLLADAMLVEQGLLSRVLVTAPESAIGTRTWHDASPDSERAISTYGARMLDVLERPLPLVVGKKNELAPRTVALSAAAYRFWVAYHDHVERRMGGELRPVRGLANKIPEIAARLAGVLTLVEDIEAEEIRSESMERGVALADHYLAEALRVFEASQAKAELLRAQELLRWLTTSWEHRPLIGLPEIYQYGPNPVRDRSTAQRLVGILVEHGHLVPIEGGAQVGNRHRRDAWRIVMIGGGR